VLYISPDWVLMRSTYISELMSPHPPLHDQSFGDGVNSDYGARGMSQFVAQSSAQAKATTFWTNVERR
jgi:hypothetical protein